MQQRAPAEKHHYAYKRQPSNQVYISTFNPHMPSGHMTSIKQYHANPYAPATTYNSSSVQTLEPSSSSSSTASTSQSTSSSPFANFNLASLTKYANVDEIKGLVDRFGGLDGILASVTKVQKVISTVGQIAPMAKVFTGLLGGKSSSSEEKQEQSYVPARRRPVTKRNNVKARGRKVQMNKKRERTRRSQVYSNTQKQR